MNIKGKPDEIIVQLTVDLAFARKANKDLHDMMSNEVTRLRSRADKMRDRWVMERDIVTDCLDDVLDLEEQVAMLKKENEWSVDALCTAQERLDNALLWCDDLSAQVSWAPLLEEN